MYETHLMAVGGLISETKFTSSSTDSSAMYSHWSAGQEVSGSMNNSSANGLPSNNGTANDLFWSTTNLSTSAGWRHQSEQRNFNGSPFWSTNMNNNNNVVKQQSEWPSSNSNHAGGQPVNGLNNKSSTVWSDVRQTPFRCNQNSVWGPPTSLLEDSVKFPINLHLDEEQDQSFRTPSDRPESEPSDSTDIFSPFPG